MKFNLMSGETRYGILRWPLMLAACGVLFQMAALSPSNGRAADWTWQWTPATDAAAPTATVEPFKYGKRWAYAVEIDDGPTWVRTFAVPFLAEYHFTDSPPGVAGGKAMPMVGGVSVIVSPTGYNQANVNWEDLRAMMASGWGVINHSFDHRGRGWDGPVGQLSDEAVRQDAFWSQAIFAVNLPDGRAPTAVVYANGYVDYDRGGALGAMGVGIATRVGGSSTRLVYSPKVKWMDFPRSYLDEGVWSKADNGNPMADFPATAQSGPAPGSLVVDFTHVIESKPESPNHKRWRTRLSTIEQRWGAKGSDELWCAPTGDVADYVRAGLAARVQTSNGKLSVTLPDNIPGSALTLRLTGLGAATIPVPPGGAVYRQGDAIFLTTPMIGKRGAAAPTPRIKRIYEGPAVTMSFAKPESVAGVTLGVFGSPKTPAAYRIAVRTEQGERMIAERTLEAKWHVGSHLCPVIPTAPAILGTGIIVQPVPELTKMTVWGGAEP